MQLSAKNYKRYMRTWGLKTGDNQLGYNYFKNPFTDRFSHNIFFSVDCSFNLTRVHVCQLSTSGLGQNP